MPSKDFFTKYKDTYRFIEMQNFPLSHKTVWENTIKLPNGYYLEENDFEGEYISNIKNEIDLYFSVYNDIENLCTQSSYPDVTSLILKNEVIQNISLMWKFYFHILQLGFTSLVFMFAFFNTFNTESNIGLHLTTRIITYICCGLSTFVFCCIIRKKIFLNWYTIWSFVFFIVCAYSTISFSTSYSVLLSDKKWLVVVPALIYGQQLLQPLHATYISYLDDLMMTFLSLAALLILSTLYIMTLFSALNPNFVLDVKNPLAYFTLAFSFLANFDMSGLTNQWYDYVTMFLFVIIKIVIMYVVLVKIGTIISTKYEMFIQNDLSVVAVHRLYVMWPYISFLKPFIRNRSIVFLKSI